MIWSERRNFCLVHIPKTGGSSLSNAYARVMYFSDVMLGGPAFAEQLQPIYQKRFGLQKHSTARNIAQVVGVDRFSAAYSFAIVRDPAERMLSYYQ